MTAEGSDVVGASDRGLTAEPASGAAPAMDGSGAATVSAEEHEMEGGTGDGGSGAAAKTGENGGIGGGGGGSGPMGARDGVGAGAGGGALQAGSGAAGPGAGGGTGSGGMSAGPSGENASSSGGGNGNASGPAPAPAPAPPPPPLLKGTLSYNVDLRRHMIRGMWNYENSTEFPPQRFELIRNLGPDEEVTTLPKDGEFHGSFSIAYHHTTAKGKKKERTMVVAESGVKITFTRVDKDKGKDDGGGSDDSGGNGNSNSNGNGAGTDNSNRIYEVAGQGNNQFGVFTIKGKATGSAHEGDPTYNVELRKKYVTSPNAGANKAGGSSKKKSKGKKRKHPLSGAAAAQSNKYDNDSHADPGSLPPPAKSYPSAVVCLRGKLTREKADVDIGAPGLESEIVHRIAGMWSSGLDLIEADPENARGLCNKFEYEHRCTVPTDIFPLSGRYAGWFYLTNEDGSRTRVAERDVTLKFRRNNAGYHNVDGKGSNAFGKYSITGTLGKDNVLTIFRHFQPRKIKKSTTPAPPPINGQGGTVGAQQAQKPEEPPGPPPIKLEEVVAPGDDKPDEPLQPISPPALGTYSAVSQGVLRINDDGSHTCTGKWAVTRDHYNNGQTSNFHFGLEAHHAVQAAEAMKKKKDGKGKDADDKDGGAEGDKTKDKPGQAGEPSTAPMAAISPFGPVTTTTFPVDSAQYKGSFKMRRGSTKYQSVVDRQIVLKFRKNKSGSYNIHGKGINSIGTFTLVGTLILSGRGSGHIELYRMYPIVPKPAPTPAPATTPLVPVWQGQGKVLPSTKPGGHHGGLHAKPGHIPQFPKPALAGTAEAAAAIPDGPMAMAGGIVAGATQHPPAFPLAAMPHPTLQRRESSRQTKLPSRLEDDDPKAQLARLMEKCTVILKLIREQDLASGAFFAEPVDPVAHGIPTYHQVISNPMDLGTVSKRMADGDIENPEDFAKLVRLVFENAIKFNIDTTHVVHQSAKHLLSLFNHKFRDVERMAEQMRKARKPTKAELKAAAREAKRKEKEAAREAKRKAKEERKRKVKAEESGAGLPENEHAAKRAKLEEVGAMAAANSKALAEMSAVASQGAAASSGVPGGGSVPRTEFNLLLDMVQQMQRQMVSMHSLLASTVEAAHASALTAGTEGAHAGAGATAGGASSNHLKAESGVVASHGHHDGGQQDHQKTKKPPKKKAKAAPKPKPSPVPAPAPASPPAPAPAPAPAVEEEKPLTVTEQEVLTETINRLPADKLPTVIEIIRESASLNGDEDEIDLEIDQLDTATQRKLQRFVLKNVKPPRRKGKAIPKKAKPAPAPSPVAKPEASPPAPASPASPAKKEEEEEGEIEEDDEENDSAKNSSKQKAKSGSFFGFGDKDDSDSDTDSDSDNSSAGGSENKADKEGGDTAGDAKSRGAGGEGSDEKSPARDSFHLGDDDNADGFGDTSMQDDDDDDDEGGGMANWGGMSKTAAPAADAEKGSDAEDEDAGNDEDDWGAALAYSASAKAKEAERKAREAKMQKDAEAARQKRLADAAAKGDEIRAQREEELAKEERLKEQKKKEEEEAIQKAREEQRKKTQSVKQTVDLDEERELMKQYEQGYLDMEMEMGGGGSSPGSDFEF